MDNNLPQQQALQPQPVQPQPVQPEPLQYHRLLRGMQNYKWWKPLVFGLLAVVFGFTLTQILGVVALIPLLLVGSEAEILAFTDRLLKLDTQDPYALAVALGSLAVWIPAIIFAAWAMGFKPAGRVWSVVYRVRWRLLFKTLGPALLALVLTQALGMIYAFVSMPEQPDAAEFAQPEGFNGGIALISLVIVLILVPLQAAAEELMFRGALMQILGAWIKSPIIPIVLPSLLFALAHLYDPWALVQVGIMGVVAAWLTWRTGGLEAAISLHIINNLVVFLLLLSGITGDTSQSQETGADWVAVLISALSFVFYAWLVLRMTHKMRITAPMGRLF